MLIFLNASFLIDLDRPTLWPFHFLDPQIAMLLFKTIQRFCKLVYLVRYCPSNTTTIPFRQFDKRVMEAIIHICGLVSQIPHPKQLSLSLKMEGFGLFRTEDLCIGTYIAFLSSCCDTAQKL
eukprot:TRINITY_DN8035_c0_g2_i1.p1 TRINITY_DN8035_c0_g2~~TRINITY_DN8035_c0_g2_i1.p1  ORF type:complete len:122 (-),score=11.28 TRINITY_DN8035_c0_g2_i1:246-611(-)